jgi:hypothetical protein
VYKKWRANLGPGWLLLGPFGRKRAALSSFLINTLHTESGGAAAAEVKEEKKKTLTRSENFFPFISFAGLPLICYIK